MFSSISDPLKPLILRSFLNVCHQLLEKSQRKSTVAILRPGGDVVTKPFDIPHLSSDFQALIDRIRSLDGETRIAMECTGRYYEPVAANSPTPASLSAP